MSPTDDKQKFGQADALYREKRYPEALQVLDELDAAHPLTKNIMFPRALCLAALGQTDEAVRVCEQLDALFQDARGQELKAQIEGKATPGANGAPANGRGRKKPSSPDPRSGGGFRFPIRVVVIVLVVIAVGVVVFPLLVRIASNGSGNKLRERPKPATSNSGPSEQEEIDKAIRRHMETAAVPPFTSLYDTGSVSKQPLTAAELTARSGWTEIAEEQTDHAFKGDAVLLNNQVAVVLRRDGTGAELCGQNPGFQNVHANLAPVGTADAQGISSIAVEKCGQDEVIVQATHGAESLKVRYELAMGQVFVKVSPVEGATKLRVEAPSRFAVLPDFFADDIVVDAREIQADKALLPSENFLLHMLGEGNAIVMDVWDNREQDVQVGIGGEPMNRKIQSSEITFGKDGAVWVALLADKGVWHMRDIVPAEKGVELPLDWQRPYPALWRVDWRRSDKLTDSWEMLTEVYGGHFKKHGLFEEEENSWTAEDWWGSGDRTRIASGLGRFRYPCWIDLDGFGWLEPLSTESWNSYQPLEGTPEFQGPAILYPLNRLEDTPLDKFTVVDIVRAGLGVGPCQYILDVEGQHEAFTGMPTCSVRDILDEIYDNDSQSVRRDDVEKALDDVVAFITLIRERIDKYAAFSKETQAYLEECKVKNAEQTAFIDEMETLIKRIDTAIAQREESIKTVKFAAKLAKDFRSDLVDYTGDDAATKCKEFTKAWVDIGGNQDTLVAECRVAVKLLRQRAALSLTQNAQYAELAGEIRARTETILRAPVNYEAPRH